ncbi:uncharacterized protein G2W53_035054 [Senna tora]|uniref:Endonuclease/exonuclease/phosphatase domain-containing protein n=1 Tax=Senna tora TaxID=362788 RepID=A0A834W764_9FABA|nr:uncharacterized protein G2W53_035054 [Senna tora]
MGATRFDILHDLGDQEERNMGSGSDTDRVGDSDKGPADPMISRSNDGKMVVMDKQQWRHAVPKQPTLVNRPKVGPIIGPHSNSSGSGGSKVRNPQPAPSLNYANVKEPPDKGLIRNAITGKGVRTVTKHGQFIHMQILDGGSCWFLTVVFGSPQLAQRRELWRNLNLIGNSMQWPWCIAGDFNAFLAINENVGGSSSGSRPDSFFREMVDTNELIDLGFAGPGVTWRRKDLAIRLDRALANVSWRMRFPEASVLHLPHFKSNHSPLLIKLVNNDPSSNRKDRPFRFLASWMLHEDFQNLMQGVWQSNWHTSLSNFHEKVST